MLGAGNLESENIFLVVADMPRQLPPLGPDFFLPPAPQGFSADVPAIGQLLLGHDGVAHWVLLGGRTEL